MSVNRKEQTNQTRLINIEDNQVMARGKRVGRLRETGEGLKYK